MKIDLSRLIFKADETPFIKKFQEQANVTIVMWSGKEWIRVPSFPEENITLGDVLRLVYSDDAQNETRENKSKKGRLLQKLNKAIRKKALFELSTDDAKLTLDEAGRSQETVLYIQIEDAIEGKPAWNEEVETIQEPPTIEGDS